MYKPKTTINIMRNVLSHEDDNDTFLYVCLYIYISIIVILGLCIGTPLFKDEQPHVMGLILLLANGRWTAIFPASRFLKPCLKLIKCDGG